MAFLIVAASGRAQENPHALWEPPEIGWPSTGTGGSVIHRHSVAGFPIVLDQTPLLDAKRDLGGVIGSSGDAGDAGKMALFLWF